MLQLITDEQNEISASQDRRAEIEASYRKRKAQIEANKDERLASFDAEIKRLEGVYQNLLGEKETGDRYNADIQRNIEALNNEKDKRDQYINSVDAALLKEIRTKQGGISKAKEEIAKSSAADPEWMKKVLDAVKIFKGNTDEDYPRTWAYFCIGFISLSVTMALEAIIWCVFAIIGEESST